MFGAGKSILRVEPSADYKSVKVTTLGLLNKDRRMPVHMFQEFQLDLSVEHTVENGQTVDKLVAKPSEKVAPRFLSPEEADTFMVTRNVVSKIKERTLEAAPAERRAVQD